MKNCLFLFLICFTWIELQAQCANVCGTNLLINPGFEIPTANCTVNDIQLYNDQTPVQGWFGTEPFSVNPMTGSTPDYFSPCAGSTNSANAPCLNGTARVGFFTKTSFGNGREYIQSQLITPLVAGKTYCFSMVVKSKVGAAGNVLSSCDGVGAWFHGLGVINIESMNSGNQFLGPGSAVNAIPQVENPAGNLIGGTCVTVTGTFCAQGNEQYIVIGNFRNDATTQISGSNPSNYMYVEDVQLFEVCPPTIQLDASPSTINCGQSSTITLNSTFPAGTNYNWTSPAGNTLSGAGPFTVSPPTTTTYTVIANYTNNCGVQSDTASVTVNVGPCGVSAEVHDTVLCSGSCYDLFAYNPTGGTPPYSYVWTDENGSSIATGQGPHTVCPTGSTYYQLTVTDVSGETFTDTAHIQVQLFPVVFAGNDTAVCNGANTLLAGQANGGTGQWENLGAGNNFSVSPTVTTTYVYTANDQGCVTSDSLTITVLPLPQATLSANPVSCFGINDGQAWISPSGTYSCQWQPGGITDDSLQQLSPGWYVAEISDTNGCMIQDSVLITSPPQLQLSVQGNTVLCLGETTDLNANISGGTPGYTVSWNNGQWTGMNINLQPGVTTTIPVEVTDAGGCTITDSVEILVHPVPQAGFLSNIILCEGMDSVLTNTSVGATNYQWFVNHLPAGNAQNLLFQENAPGCYDVELVASNNQGCSDTLLQLCAVNVEAAPQASLSCSSTALTIDYPNVVLSNQSVAATNCQWFINGVLFHTGCDNTLNYTFPQTGNYTVTLITTNVAGCLDADSLTIEVREGLIYYIPNAFTPDGDEHNNVFSPVFTSGFDPADFHLEIYDRWGEQIFESHNAEVGWDGTYQNRLCKEGIYTWVIRFKDLYTDENYHVHGSIALIR